MSLKAFHVFFVILAGLLCIGFGVWCVQAQQPVAAVLSFAAVAGLVIFEILFLRRMKGVK
jgi:hypothetical protein